VRWTDEQVALLKLEYPDRQTEEVAKHLGVEAGRVYAKASSLGLHKSASFMESDRSGRIRRGRTDPKMVATQFKPGQESWNKGVKGICGTHPNSRRTQFKKGSMSGAAQHNYLPIGSYRYSKDGYLEQKTNDDHPVPARRWVGVHRLVWESGNGPVPPGHVVCFRPGHKTAQLELITLDAVELVTRADLARRNSPMTKDPEVAKLVQLKGAITRQVNRIARETKEPQS
jgi:hypothetical protein